jgi:DNA topoisomerase-3
MLDFEYRQTVVTMKVPVPERGAAAAAEFRAVGHIPLVQGWKAAFGAADPEPGREKEREDGAEQTLPQLVDGQQATLTQPRVQAKQTQPPPRYNEGTLVDAMQNAWRFVKDEALRERLKEAKGIGTPATRAEIITGLKRQNLLAADGKLVVPTPAGLQLFELLRAAAPTLVDPGTTAVWEMRLDDVVVGKADFRAVINEIADEADRLITILRRHNGNTVNLSQPVSVSGRRGRPKVERKSRAGGRATATSDVAKPKGERTRRAKNASHQQLDEPTDYRRPKRKRPKSSRPSLRPPAWSLSRRGLQRIRRPPCHPTTQTTSISAAASSINTLRARALPREVVAEIAERAGLRHEPDHGVEQTAADHGKPRHSA